MPYLVELSTRALQDLDDLYFVKNVWESQSAAKWFSGLEEAIESLAILFDRCPIAPEGRGTARELRNLLYGNKPHVYQVIYEVDESRKMVKGDHVRHGARPSLKLSDLS